MELIDISQINEIISNSNFDWYKSIQDDIYTPQISSLKVKGTPKKICSYDDRQYIRDKFINFEDTNRPILEEDLEKVYNFMLGENVPNEYKEKLSVRLTEEMKEHIFIEYLTQVLPYTSVLTSYEDDDYVNKITKQKYVPRHNHIPLRYYSIDKYGSIVYNDFSIDYEKILEAVKNNYANLTKEEVYSLKHLFSDVSFFNDKWLPKNTLKLKTLINSQAWREDEEKLCENNDRLIIERVKGASRRTTKPINENFSNEIIKSIPSDFSTMEKAIYVYSKLCRLLSYDAVYYITEDKNSDILNVDDVDTYDENNNFVVCHHFAYILSNILRKIGIEFIEENIYSFITNGKKQFSGHSNIRFLIDDNVVFADSTKTVTFGDLTNHKFQNKLTGIRCELYNETKQLELEQAKKRVEKYLDEEESKNKVNLPTEDEYEDLSINEKYIFFNNCLSEVNLYGVDLISYAVKLIQLLGLNINTKIMYRIDNLKDILLSVELDSYLEDGSIQKITYLIDTNSKQIYNGIDSTISFKEMLTVKAK